MRITSVLRTARAAALAMTAGLVLLGGAASPAVADSSPSAVSSEDGDAPTQAGTSFRTATEIEQGRKATANGSAGDYMYWSFPADAEQRPTVTATVQLPESTRSASSTWQLDVYDGLRRRQACQYGAQTRTAAQDADLVTLTCVLRTVRAWSEPWANDPLPGTYYVRLTTTELATADLGVPVSAMVRVDSKDMGGAAAVDGSLAEPLVPGIAVTGAENTDSDEDSTAVLSSLEPEDGWSSGWWSSRWVWTAAGGVLAALAGVAGYALTRGSGRPSRVPPPGA
ncbi:hypothetical protein [Streptomyces poonensis]|uniref:Secreted protein n=1 Tax=Streptomyces poonensis TaxID=68255 RepID=A0A918Q5V9_9ACTN|nr:hypothetical protein [Streptomyces poonensis]GGZ32844.1 hypothetical protein GCM10010365_62240 [Streptomyces poonensis]GLJ93167.1 hypothetical protein GCM10017589_57790 [Streptomyces poonensis]